MGCSAQYHPEVKADLENLGRTEALRVLKAIDQRIRLGEPDKVGKPLSGTLKGCRRIRVGNTRIVYRIFKQEVKVLILAAGLRKESLVYNMANQRC